MIIIIIIITVIIIITITIIIIIIIIIIKKHASKTNNAFEALAVQNFLILICLVGWGVGVGVGGHCYRRIPMLPPEAEFETLLWYRECAPKRFEQART